jgi:hypothetical protein
VWLPRELGIMALPAVGKQILVEHRRAILPCYDYYEVVDYWRNILRRSPRMRLNLGMLTGGRSMVAVGDVDPRHDGSLDTLRAMGWPVEETVVVRTGGDPPGWHVWVQCPLEGLPNCSKYGQGIEFKADGLLVIVPWSQHPKTGNRYEYLTNQAPWQTEIAPLPATVLADLRARAPHVSYGGGRSAMADEGALTGIDIGWSRREVRARAMRFYRQALWRVRNRGEGRNNTLFWLSGQLLALGFSGHELRQWADAFAQEVGGEGNA